MDARIIHHKASLLPVTATVIAEDRYLLAEGTRIRIYERATFKYVTDQQVLEDQAIHGFTDFKILPYAYEFYVWGGRQIRKITILKTKPIDSIKLGPIAVVADWLLKAVNLISEKALGLKALLLTAHNTLLGLRNVTQYDEDGIAIEELAYGPRSLLFAADLLLLPDDLVGVAAGDAVGKIVVWSYSLRSHEEKRPRVHYVFSSHQGSIFGLRFAQDRNLTRKKSTLQPYLVSCSDDRSIKVWDVRNLYERAGIDVSLADIGTAVKASKDANENLIASATGHASRIWDAMVFMVNSSHINILSIGEDATTKLWALSPGLTGGFNKSTAYTLKHKQSFAFNSKRNIWCIAVSTASTSNCEVLIGGADGKIVRYFVGASDPNARNERQILANKRLLSFQSTGCLTDFLRDYDFLDVNTIIGVTNNGIVLVADIQIESKDGESWPHWKKVGQIESLRSCSRIKCVRDFGRAFIVGASGPLYVYGHASQQLFNLTTINAKVGNIFIQKQSLHRVSLVITHVESNEIQFLVINIVPEKDPKLVNSSAIQLPVLFVVTSAACAAVGKPDSHLFLGGRNGSILVITLDDFEPENGRPQSLAQLDNIHQGESVTALLVEHESTRLASEHGIEQEEGFNWLISTGRDGNLSIIRFKRSFNADTARVVHKIELPFGPHVEGLYKDPKSDLLYVYGFRGSDFVVYNEALDQEVLTVECGGAHRKWSFIPFVGVDSGKFAWTKNSILRLKFICKQPYEIIRSGGHGREIKAMAISPDVEKNSCYVPLIATGAEDTDIRLFAFSEEKQPHFACLTVIRKHVTGIQQLKWCSEGRYLFTCGGFQEFFIWRIRRIPVVSVGAVCESACPVNASDKELRITGFCVRAMEKDTDTVRLNNRSSYLIIMAYSDSTINIHRYNPNDLSWKQLQKSSYRSCCLTQVSDMSLAERHILFGAATDGCLAFWPFQRNLKDETSESSKLHAVDTFLGQDVDVDKIHQNGIACMKHCILGSSLCLLATGGDDGTLAISYLSVSNPSLPSIELTTRVLGAHAASLSALIIFNCAEVALPAAEKELSLSIVSCGKDQRLKLWRLAVDVTEQGVDRIDVTCAADVFCPVADVASIALLSQAKRPCFSIVVAGSGLYIWDITGFT